MSTSETLTIELWSEGGWRRAVTATFSRPEAGMAGPCRLARWGLL